MKSVFVIHKLFNRLKDQKCITVCVHIFACRLLYFFVQFSPAINTGLICFSVAFPDWLSHRSVCHWRSYILWLCWWNCASFQPSQPALPLHSAPPTQPGHWRRHGHWCKVSFNIKNHFSFTPLEPWELQNLKNKKCVNTSIFIWNYCVKVYFLLSRQTACHNQSWLLFSKGQFSSILLNSIQLSLWTINLSHCGFSGIWFLSSVILMQIILNYVGSISSPSEIYPLCVWGLFIQTDLSHVLSIRLLLFCAF